MAMDRRARALTSLVLGAILATLVVYLAIDTIACPAGYGDPSASHVDGPGKTRIKITCRAGGAQADGSMALIMLSWIGLFLAVTIGTYKVWSRVQPLPPEPIAAAPDPTAPLTDKKERRKARKQAKRG